MDTKLCCRCSQNKPIESFRVVKANKDGRCGKCKLCEREYQNAWRQQNPEKRKAQDARANQRAKEAGIGAYAPEAKERNRNNHLKRSYGITLEEYQRMHEEQGGRCAACKEERELVVDHCHRSGKVRKLLCQRCNRTLGFVNDDSTLLFKLADYLESK
jgi:hypothetical protein